MKATTASFPLCAIQQRNSLKFEKCANMLLSESFMIRSRLLSDLFLTTSEEFFYPGEKKFHLPLKTLPQNTWTHTCWLHRHRLPCKCCWPVGRFVWAASLANTSAGLWRSTSSLAFLVRLINTLATLFNVICEYKQSNRSRYTSVKRTRSAWMCALS